MNAAILVLGSAGVGGYLWYLHEKSAKAAPKSTALATTTSTATPSPATTAAAAAVHGRLMHHEYRPHILRRAASIFGQEGFVDAARGLEQKAELAEMQMRETPDLVERARLGDQNAIALITQIREGARRGNLRSNMSARLMEEYINTHPADPPGGLPPPVTAPPPYPYPMATPPPYPYPTETPMATPPPYPYPTETPMAGSPYPYPTKGAPPPWAYGRHRHHEPREGFGWPPPNPNPTTPPPQS